MGSTKFTALDLELLGMEETFPGSGIYEKNKKIIKVNIKGQDFFINKDDHDKQQEFLKNQEEQFDFGVGFNTENKHKTIGFEVENHIAKEAVNARRNSWKETGKIDSFEVGLFADPQNYKDLLADGGFVKTSVDLKNNFETYSSRRTEPFPIAEIRLLTGKKRDVAVAELQEEAKRFVQGIGITEIYIPTNVASSKNSKQLFKTGKKNATVTRDKEGNTNTTIKETSFITDSQVSKAYRKETANSWVTNRLKFSSALQGLNKPYSIELTFIRTTLGRFDFHNMAQLPFDLMVEHGWIVDDESAEVVPVFNKCVYYSKYFAGLVIRVIR